MALNPQKVGIAVYCVICARMKQPVGRSAPMDSALCEDECPGYWMTPLPGSLWPNESEFDFGYEVSNSGTITK